VKGTLLNNAVYSIICHVDGPPTPLQPTTFWEVLLKWQSSWMWENLAWMGDGSWIMEAISNNSCIAVTDGTFMVNLYPIIHAAALVIE
jgi:hypothetical protein